MKAYDTIISKQIQWALNRGIKLVGSKGQRGRLAYSEVLEDNLFEPLIPKVKKEIEEGDGSELVGDRNSPPKMHAVHSSSALSVNVFQHWQKKEQFTEIAAACGLCSPSNSSTREICFERKYKIDSSYKRSPNIDVEIANSPKSNIKAFAIESKLTESYSPYGHGGISQKYLDNKDIWVGLSNLFNVAKSICPKDNVFVHLHAAQLVKHILGLNKKYGKKKYRLLYLWYDCFGREGAQHSDEIVEFSDRIKKDEIYFHFLTYQELIVRLSNKYRGSHPHYIRYITERYL